METFDFECACAGENKANGIDIYVGRKPERHIRAKLYGLPVSDRHDCRIPDQIKLETRDQFKVTRGNSHRYLIAGVGDNGRLAGLGFGDTKDDRRSFLSGTTGEGRRGYDR